MNLIDLMPEVNRATAEMQTQDTYVQALGAKIQAGERTIRIYDEAAKVWTTVNLTEFWQVQYNKYLGLSGYAGDLNGLATNLQAALDSAFATIAKPEDRKATM